MHRLLRKARAVVVAAASFALFWGIIGLIGGLIANTARDEPISKIVRYAWQLTCYGFASGMLFALLFATWQRGRKLQNTSTIRAACWGGLGGLLFVGISIILARVQVGVSPSPQRLAKSLAAFASLGSVTTVWLLAVARNRCRSRMAGSFPRAQLADTSLLTHAEQITSNENLPIEARRGRK